MGVVWSVGGGSAVGDGAWARAQGCGVSVGGDGAGESDAGAFRALDAAGISGTEERAGRTTEEKRSAEGCGVQRGGVVGCSGASDVGEFSLDWVAQPVWPDGSSGGRDGVEVHGRGKRG